MRSRLRRWLQLFCLIAFLVATGCYTTLRHPGRVSLTSEEGTQRDCLDCHEDGSFHSYDPYSYGVYYDYYPPLWRYYYGRPWWYEDYWYYDSPGESADESAGPRAVRRGLWSRGSPGLTLPFIGSGRTGD